MSLLLVALVLAQADTDLVCQSVRASGYVEAPVVFTPYVMNQTVGGIGLYSARGHLDPDTALSVVDEYRDPYIDPAPAIQVANPRGRNTLVDNRGTVYGGGQMASDNGQAAFQCVADSSGAPCMDCRGNPGCYISIVGGLPLYATDAGAPYGGRHGEITFATKERIDAGWLAEFENGGLIGWDKKLAVDFKGGVIWPSADPLANFDSCGYTLNLLPVGGEGVLVPGQHYYGEGPNTLRAAADGLYYCEPQLADGSRTGWSKVCTSQNSACDLLYASNAVVAALAARVAALEARCP